jgi:hypothetical protein
VFPDEGAIKTEERMYYFQDSDTDLFRLAQTFRCFNFENILLAAEISLTNFMPMIHIHVLRIPSNIKRRDYYT